MKKIINILSLSAMLLAFTSCEDWLEMPSEAKADSSTIFETIGRAEMTVVGCYANTFNRELYYQLGMGTDECISTEGTTNSKNQVANYQYTTSNIPTSTYTAMYKGIEYANVCIKNLPLMTAASESEQKKINSLLGEALAIRAMNYWNLVRFFGDVPYSDVPVADLGTFSSSRVSRDVIYDNCVADLQRAVELLPWANEGTVVTPERFTKNSAYGILARVALYAAGYSLRWDLSTVPYNASTVQIARRSDAARVKELYEIAANACKAVIEKKQNSLLDDYDAVFRDLMLGKYNSETMLEYGQWGSDVNGSSAGYTNGAFAHTNSTFKKSAPQMVAIPTYYFEFEDGDVRRDVTICNYGITAADIHQMNAYSAGNVGKFRVNWKSEVGTAVNKRDINWPVLRYSDVLLMYAEALNEVNNGPTTEAINALKEVRKRAFGGDESKIGAIPTNHDDFLDKIIEERKLELGFESWRRTDLARWGILYETLTNEKAKLLQLAKREGKYAGVDKYRAYKESKAVFKDPTVAVSFISIPESKLTEQQIKDLDDKGVIDITLYEDGDGNVYYSESEAPANEKVTGVAYKILDMFGNVSTNNGNKVAEDQAWMTTQLFRGLEKNKVEILPLNTTSVIDINPGLAGQQHPCY